MARKARKVKSKTPAKRKLTPARARGKTAKRAAAKRTPAKASRRIGTVEARKAARAKTTKKSAPAKKRGSKDVLGEGNYTATRNFDKAQTSFVKRNKGHIGKMGKDAEKALEGTEGPALRDAEKEAASHGHEDKAA